MTFASPFGLLGLLVVPIGITVYWIAQRRRAKYAVRFTNLDLLASVVEKTPGWRRHLPSALYLLALAALAIALARPQTTQSVAKQEATVILVMDLSGSMNATDVQPTRLDAAKSSAKVLVDVLPANFQVALIGFSNTVRTVVQPTTDRKAAVDGLNSLVANGGTAMGDALMQAIDLASPLPASDGSGTSGVNPTTPTPAPSAAPNAPGGHSVVIVLLSDGASNLGVTNPVDAANEAAARGVPIFTVGLGTQQGVVDVRDGQGRLRRIAVPPDLSTLKAVANITGARTFPAPNAEELKTIYADLGSTIGYEDKEREVTFLFAGAAAGMILVAGGLSLRWFNRFP